MAVDNPIQDKLDAWAATVKHYLIVAFSVAVPLGVVFGFNAGSIQTVDSALIAAVGAAAVFGGPIITSIVHLRGEIKK